MWLPPSHLASHRRLQQSIHPPTMGLNRQINRVQITSNARDLAFPARLPATAKEQEPLMRSLFAISSLIVCALLALPQHAAAQSPVITEITPEALAAALKAAGWKSEVAVANNQKYVKFSIMNNRFNAVADLFGCDAQGCTLVTYGMVFIKSDKQTPAFINNLNSRVRFIRAYLLDDGRLVIQSDVDLTGGATLRHLQEAGGNFEGAIGEFIKMINS
jgi:hypothetical protein